MGARMMGRWWGQVPSVCPLGQAVDRLTLVEFAPLCSDQGSGETHGVGDQVELAAVILVPDPHGLAVFEAGGRREAHRSSVG